MRTGSEYREALRDGRRIWVMGEGLIEDVTLHPATRPMVEEYVAWYDRHQDPEWQDVLLAPPDDQGRRTPWAFAIPRSAADLRAMGRSYSETIFLTAGNMTHTPGYGNLIALGIHDVVQQRNVSREQIAAAGAYRDLLARTGRVLTFSAGAATIGYRLREDADQRAALRVVRETDAGLVVSGKVGMHTSPAYAEDVYVGAHCGVDRDGHRATFVVPVNASGVTVLCRKISARHANPFLAPLSSRFDELDGQMWLENVLIPWERVFL
ncbi:MAG TPA: 4-hydroxyphenylacetate 3-hydroxylase N-terminal domain-containing protein, partial [Methylomirabilota bacterium]